MDEPIPADDHERSRSVVVGVALSARHGAPERTDIDPKAAVHACHEIGVVHAPTSSAGRRVEGRAESL
jgi:hypothetical protein